MVEPPAAIMWLFQAVMRELDICPKNSTFDLYLIYEKFHFELCQIGL